jgi:hypothetical protein
MISTFTIQGHRLTVDRREKQAYLTRLGDDEHIGVWGVVDGQLHWWSIWKVEPKDVFTSIVRSMICPRVRK